MGEPECQAGAVRLELCLSWGRGGPYRKGSAVFRSGGVGASLCGEEGQPGLPLYIICSRREAEDTLLEFGVEHSGRDNCELLFRCKHKVAQLTHK